MLDRFCHSWDWLVDQVIAAGFGIVGCLDLPTETPVNRAIREDGERLRLSFPTIDFDNPVPRRSQSSDARFR
jgi:hypothetical protein